MVSREQSCKGLPWIPLRASGHSEACILLAPVYVGHTALTISMVQRWLWYEHIARGWRKEVEDKTNYTQAQVYKPSLNTKELLLDTVLKTGLLIPIGAVREINYG